MIDISINDNLKKLKKKFKNEHPDAIVQISEWEKKLKEASDLDDFCKLDTTKIIKEKLTSRLRENIRRRIKDGETPEEKSMKEVLSWLSPNAEAEIKLIAEEIELNLAE